MNTVQLPEWLQEAIEEKAKAFGPAHAPLFKRDAEWTAKLIIEKLSNHVGLISNKNPSSLEDGHREADQIAYINDILNNVNHEETILRWVNERKQISSEARPGPWESSPCGMSPERMRSLPIIGSHNRTPYIDVANAEFISDARDNSVIWESLVPELLTALRFAKNDLKRAYEVIKAGEFHESNRLFTGAAVSRIVISLVRCVRLIKK